MPDEMIYPNITAVWEKELEEISKGKEDYETLYKNQLKNLSDLLEEAKNAKIKLSEKVEKCPKCKTGYFLKHKGKKGTFWSCSNYPECKETRQDKNGKPEKNKIEN